MKINELIASSAEITSYNHQTNEFTEGHYSSSYVFNNKKIGPVLEYNKTVLYKPESSVIEVGIYFKSVTERRKAGHYCQIALRGIEMEEKSVDEVLDHLRRKNNGKYANLSDDELLEIIARGDNVYYGKYVIQSRNRPDKFLVMQPTISQDTDVRVRCSCASFMFDVAWYNADHHCLIGSRPPQTRKFKLDKDDTPTRNIYRTPGLCKHLMLAMALLTRDGFIKGGSDTFNREGALALKKARSSKRITRNDANFIIRETINQARSQIRYTRQMWSGKEAEVPHNISEANIGTFWDKEAVPKEIKRTSNANEIGIQKLSALDASSNTPKKSFSPKTGKVTRKKTK